MHSAIKMLKRDHARVKGLFKLYRAASDTAYATKKKIGALIIEELNLHMEVEEKIFYPVLDTQLAKKDKRMVAEAYEEHALVKELIDDVKGFDPKDLKHAAKFKVIIDLIEHHVEEEEDELFPHAQKVLGEHDKALGDAIFAYKMPFVRQDRKAGESVTPWAW